ncbi:MAG: arginase [Proteobacteria bacterium]|nr:arginase [Pseudomonadota bacterium]
MTGAIADARAQRIALREEERALRLWASRRRMRALAARLGAASSPPGSGPLVTFYGSGDYHHLATTLIAAAGEPVTVIHFDNHPDWVRVPATHNCGGWVNRVLALPNVARVVTLGVCSDDLVLPQTKTANLAALASGRLEVHPWRAPPSRVWGRIGDGYGRRRVGRHLVWDCLADRDWPAFVDSLAARLPPGAVWVTIDKDVLRPEDAVTNWDQGQMPLDALLEALRRIAAARRIAGVDVCGEYSPPRFDGPVKRIAAWLDHPDGTLPRTDAHQRNDRTNRALVETLAGVLP